MTSGALHTPEELQAMVDRGPYPSATKEAEFLFEEVYKMCKRRHAMVFSFLVVKRLQGVRVDPPGVVPQRNQKPRTICDLTHSGVNTEIVNLAYGEAIQIGTALRRLLFQIHRADSKWGPVSLSQPDKIRCPKLTLRMASTKSVSTPTESRSLV